LSRTTRLAHLSITFHFFQQEFSGCLADSDHRASHAATRFRREFVIGGR
jgi:hypothetical protein